MASSRCSAIRPTEGAEILDPLGVSQLGMYEAAAVYGPGK
jgi:hypothetical protein